MHIARADQKCLSIWRVSLNLNISICNCKIKQRDGGLPQLRQFKVFLITHWFFPDDIHKCNWHIQSSNTSNNQQIT